MTNGLNIIFPYNDHSGKNINEQTLAMCKRLGVNATSNGPNETLWKANPDPDDILYLADNKHMRTIWYDLMVTRRHQVFVIRESQGKIPCKTMALAYMASYSSPHVSFICQPKLSTATALAKQLFVDDNPSPPPIYESILDLLGAIRVAA